MGHIEFTEKCFSSPMATGDNKLWFIKRLLMKLPVLPKQSWFGVISIVIKKLQLFTGERGNYGLGATEEIRSLPLFDIHSASCTVKELIHFILFFKVWTIYQVVEACRLNEGDNLVHGTMKYKLLMHTALNTVPSLEQVKVTSVHLISCSLSSTWIEWVIKRIFFSAWLTAA